MLHNIETWTCPCLCFAVFSEQSASTFKDFSNGTRWQTSTRIKNTCKLHYHNRRHADKAACVCSCVKVQLWWKRKKWAYWELPWQRAEQSITSYCTIEAVFILDSPAPSTRQPDLWGQQSGLDKKRQTALKSLVSSLCVGGAGLMKKYSVFVWTDLSDTLNICSEMLPFF